MKDGFLSEVGVTCDSSRVLRTSAANSYNFSSKLCNLNLVFLSVEEMEAERRMELSAGNFSRSAYGLRVVELE